MHELNSIVAIYETPVDAVQGANDLHTAGFNMLKLSIAAKECPGPEHIVGYCNTGTQVKYWGKMGTLWEGLCAYWASAAFFDLPGTGPVLLAGPLVAGIVDSMEGAKVSGGMGVFRNGLRRLGIPKESIVRYESELCAERLLLIAHGTPEELLRAKDVLHETRPTELNIHFAGDLKEAEVCH